MKNLNSSNGFTTFPRNMKPNKTEAITTKVKYKDYSDFLESYNESKSLKDDQESVSSTDSGFSASTETRRSYRIENKSNNTSASSLNSESSVGTLKHRKSEANGVKSTYGSYRDFLETYGTKKFSSVRPCAGGKLQGTVKSEIFIEVKPPVQMKSEKVQVRCVGPDEIDFKIKVPSYQSNGFNTLPNKATGPKLPVVEKHSAVPTPPKMPEAMFPTSFNRQKGSGYIPNTHRMQSEKATVIPPPPPKFPTDNLQSNVKTVVPVADTNGRVDKNDPNVKKLVYNTYRGLLGAYNNKANDMISTLPRSRVREDQGIAKQLESITLQGGLEKLNGRTNPNVEIE